MTKLTVSKHWRKTGPGFNPIRSTPPCLQ